MPNTKFGAFLLFSFLNRKVTTCQPATFHIQIVVLQLKKTLNKDKNEN